MAEQGEATLEGSPTDQPAEQGQFGDTKPFFSTVTPNGSRPQSLDFERSDSTDNLPKESCSGKSDPPEGSIPEDEATAAAAAHSGEMPPDGKGDTEGTSTSIPEPVASTTQAAAPPLEEPPDGQQEGAASNNVPVTVSPQTAGQSGERPQGAAPNGMPEETGPMLQAGYPENSCLIVVASTAPPASNVTATDGSPSSTIQTSNSSNRQNRPSENSCGLVNTIRPVPETNGQKYLANKGSFSDPNISKKIPLSECCLKVPRNRLCRSYKCDTTCALGKHRAHVEVMIEPDLTNMNPDGSYSRKARATLCVQVLQMDQNYTYKVAVLHVFLADPIAGTLNDDSFEARDKKFQIPQGRDTVTFDVDLGPALPEKIEKCTSMELELHFKMVLHLETIYISQEKYIPSFGPYVDIVHYNNRQ